MAIWQKKGTQFGDDFLRADTQELDELLPSWEAERERLQEDSEAFREFQESLKRQHAIETGVIEGLYTLSRGITETFIEQGIKEDFLQPGDTDLSGKQLMGYLESHMQAIDYVFQLVKEERPLSAFDIRELHQLVTRAQETTEALDQFGNKQQVRLEKGVFKTQPSNPKRQDGTVVRYCPPEQVESEVERMLSLYGEKEKEGLHPVVLAAWLHHAFTQIHPFQDGNGRIARLLATLVLVKHHLFYFTVNRNERVTYIEALEAADQGDAQPLVSFFARNQRKNIERVLTLPEQGASEDLENLVGNFLQKAQKAQAQEQEALEKRRNENRQKVFETVLEQTSQFREQLIGQIPIEQLNLGLGHQAFNEENSHYYRFQIVEYAKHHQYFANLSKPRAWIKISGTDFRNEFTALVITLHHYGYKEGTLAIGAFLETSESQEGEQLKDSSPVPFLPHTIALDTDNLRNQYVERYTQDLLKYFFGQITQKL